MTNQFLVQVREIGLVDDADFVLHGGESLHFGVPECEVVGLDVTGTAESIGWLAHTIIAHHTAAH